MKLRTWEMVQNFRFPFVRPQLPSPDEIDRHFCKARSVHYFSNFGPASIDFEELVEARYGPLGRAIACANCTTGLSASLIALRVDGPVLVPAFTFPATLSAVRGAGLQAVVGDVDPNTGILPKAEIERHVQKSNCKAAIIVRPYGIWTDILPLIKTCRSIGIEVVVDNAAGFGIEGSLFKESTSHSAIEVFSLHATKPFGVGEGGIIWAPPGLENDLRSAINFGLWSLGTLQPGQGLNGKMDELTASMALAVWERWPPRLKERQRFAEFLNRKAREAGFSTYCAPGDEEFSPWQCFPVKLPRDVRTETVVRLCADLGLQVRRYYYPALDVTHAPGHARDLADRTVCLPVYDGAYSAHADEVWSIFLTCVNTARRSQAPAVSAIGENEP